MSYNIDTLKEMFECPEFIALMDVKEFLQQRRRTQSSDQELPFVGHHTKPRSSTSSMFEYSIAESFTPQVMLQLLEVSHSDMV